jgi:hypothetical protein
LSTVKKHVLALARLPALLNRQTVDKTIETSKPPPIFLPLVAQRVSFATVFRACKNNGLGVVKVSCKSPFEACRRLPIF